MAGFPGIDRRGNGGYIVLPPSINEFGSYEAVDELLIAEAPQWLLTIDNQESQETSHNQPGWVCQLMQGVPEGQRNDAGIRLAGYFRNILPQAVTEQILLDWNSRNSPPLDKEELLRTIASSYRLPEHPIPPNGNGTLYINKNKRGILKGEDRYYPCDAEAKSSQTVMDVTNRHKPSQLERVSREDIRNYLSESSGKWIFIRDLDGDLGIREPEDKHLRRQSIYQMIKDGLVERDPILDNKIRFVNSSAGKLELSLANLGDCLPIKFPFSVQDKVNLYPKNIVVVAGTQNAGKTALLLNVARMNREAFNVVYFSSEMAEQELTERLMCFGEGLEPWQKVDFRERSHDFADVIRPDDFNILDYIELPEDVWKIGGILESIYNRLRKGIAVVAIQKKENQTYGRGQEFSAEKPRLYLSMDAGRLTIVKGKNWHDKKDNPNRQYVTFKIVNGCEFIPTSEWIKN